MSRILITPRSLSVGGHPGLQPLVDAGFDLVTPSPGATPSEAELIQALPGCVGWLAGVEHVSPKVLEAAADLRAISRNGTGVDNLPMAALEARKIFVKRAPAANARGVAELALALTMAGMRRVVPTHIGMTSGAWPRQIGREMKEASVGVIGLGAIGATFAEFCLLMGAKVRGYDPFADPDVIVHERFKRVAFGQAFEGADVVSLHAPMPENNVPLVGAKELGAMVDGGVLVNTARAGLVDDVALLVALEEGHVGTYATDVFDSEPPDPTPLLAHPHVVLTSHIGGFTKESVSRATTLAVKNLLEALGADAT